MRMVDKARQFELDQASLNTKYPSRLYSKRWRNALDFSLKMHVERCIVKNRERLAGPLFLQWISVKAQTSDTPKMYGSYVPDCYELIGCARVIVLLLLLLLCNVAHFVDTDHYLN